MKMKYVGYVYKIYCTVTSKIYILELQHEILI